MKPVIPELRLEPGQTVYIYSKGMRHRRGSAVVDHISDDGTVFMKGKLPDGTQVNDLLLDRPYEPPGDIMRSILAQYKDTNPYCHSYKYWGPHYVRQIPRCDSFEMIPYGKWANERFAFFVTPAFIGNELFWNFNVIAEWIRRRPQ
jgi:hypothetical protein